MTVGSGSNSAQFQKGSQMFHLTNGITTMNRMPSAMPRLITFVFIVAMLFAAAGMRFWPVATASAAEVAPPFGWSMLPRHTGTSLIDPNNLAAAREYVNPTDGYRVRFDGCDAVMDNFTRTTHTYTITGGALTAPKVVSASAEAFMNPPKLGGGFEPFDCASLRVITPLQQGTYSVSLNVTMADGYTADSAPQTIVVKDILIISVGDSYGSGEGAPDSFVKFGLLGYAETPAVWQDQRCHRSAWAGASKAAAILEQSDPHTSVTFVSLACSGATINTPIDDNPDDGVVNMAKYQGGGLLTGYSGIEHDGSYNPTSFLPPQMEQAARIANGRAIDALTISGGGNDMHFANVIIDCVLSDCSTNTTTANRIANDFIQLEIRYQELAAFINNERDTSDVPALNITPDRVFITEYPDPTRDMDGSWCQVNQLDDPLLAFPVTGITRTEMAWASGNLVKPMNQAIQNYATQHGWNYVTGIAAEFFGDPANGVPGRGWCALGEDANGEPNNWVNRSVQALGMQGPVTAPLGLFAFYGTLGIGLSIVSGGISLVLTLVSAAVLIVELKGTAGTMHPNRMGQMVYARHIASAVQNRFNGVVPQPGDTTPPAIAPAQNITVETLDAAGAIVNYPIPATTDNVDGPGLASCAPVSGGLFPIGTTPVTCSAQDSSGNQAPPVNFSVTVEPTTGALPDPAVVRTSLRSGCTYANSDDQSIENGAGPVSFDGTNVTGYAGVDALKARASATNDDCGMRVTSAMNLTVGAGETNLVDGDPVLLVVTLGLDGTLTTSADDNQVAIAEMAANYSIAETNCLSPGPSPALFGDDGGYCPSIVDFSASIDMDQYGGATDQWYARAMWSVTSNVGDEQSDFADIYCDDGCADPVRLPFNTGVRTVIFESFVGARLSVSGMLDTFATGYLGATAVSDFANTFSLGVVQPAAGFEGLSIDYTQEVINQSPTVEIAGPYSVEEGDSVTLTASGNDPEGSALTYVWDLDGDGEYETSGQDATFSAAAIDGPASQPIAVQVTDAAGASANASGTIEILNATPVVIAGDGQTIDEGSQFAATGSYSDEGTLDTHTATVNYGDGSGDEPLTLNVDRSFALAHSYSDNGTYVATVSVTDDDGATGTVATTITVNNVAPTVTLGDDATLRRGETLMSSGSFADPGTDDWTATVDYGDGSATEALTLNADGTFTLGHVYTSAGAFTVSVCVSDDDSGQGCDTLGVTVTPYAIFAGGDDCGSGSAYTIEWSGSTGTLYGDLHSNSGLKVSGSKNTGNGSASYRCQVKVSGSQNTFTSGPNNLTETRPWPVQMDATSFTCDVTVAGKLDLSKDGVWWVGGTKTSQQLASLTLCADEITLGDSNITGSVTLVAERISLSGSNIQLTAHQHSVLIFATGGDKKAIKVSGSTSQLVGDFVARAGGIDLSGSGSQIFGAVIGWTVKLVGSNWTVDARATVTP